MIYPMEKEPLSLPMHVQSQFPQVAEPERGKPDQVSWNRSLIQAALRMINMRMIDK
jgi:hypothetical protein